MNVVILCSQLFITKTCPGNVYPLEPHFYIAKLGYAGVHLVFLFLLQNIDCGYSLELPRYTIMYVEYLIKLEKNHDLSKLFGAQGSPSSGSLLIL